MRRKCCRLQQTTEMRRACLRAIPGQACLESCWGTAAWMPQWEATICGRCVQQREERGAAAGLGLGACCWPVAAQFVLCCVAVADRPQLAMLLPLPPRVMPMQADNFGKGAQKWLFNSFKSTAGGGWSHAA